MIPDCSMVGRVDARSPDKRYRKVSLPRFVSALEEEGKREPWWPSASSPRNTMRCFSAGSLGIALGFSLGLL